MNRAEIIGFSNYEYDSETNRVMTNRGVRRSLWLRVYKTSNGREYVIAYNNEDKKKRLYLDSIQTQQEEV